MEDEALATLRPYVDRGRHAYRNRAIGLYVAAGVVLAITAAVAGADFYRAGPILLVVVLALAGAGSHLWYRRLDWAKHPVLLALATAPGDVVAADVLAAPGRAGLSNERQVEIRTARASVLLTNATAELSALGEALAARCPKARVRGFDALVD